jgi:hypothetical protein
MKRLGAVLLQDAVWALPATPATREQLQWLAAEIVELGGEARVWEARVAIGEDESLVRQFRAQVDLTYAEILASLAREDAEVAALARRYQQARALDYFPSEAGEQARAALLNAQGRGDA